MVAEIDSVHGASPAGNYRGRVAENLVVWCTFVGAWLLVAGPVFQAALELQEQEFERDRLEAVSADLPKPAPISAWWWLFPPGRYWLERRRAREYRGAVVSRLEPRDLELLVRYLNKATGWLFVGLGGFLLATGETWEVIEHFDWPVYLFWLGMVAMSTLCLLNTVLRQRRSAGMLSQAGP